jgi:hypothetical protein
MSETDIEKGSRGLSEVGSALEGTKVGISCLTPENLTAPWILYEAGALSKTIDDKTRLCTYLLAGLEFQDIASPLGMFQATKADKEDTRRMVRTINNALSESPVSEANLDRLFDRMWPDLEQKLQTMPQPEQVVEAKRSEYEMIAEILEITRSEANRRTKTDWLDQYVPVIQELLPFLSDALRAAKSAQAGVVGVSGKGVVTPPASAGQG